MAERDSLRELIREAKAGDASSFERIVVLHQSLVLRVAQRLLLNGEDAKDAAQEVFCDCTGVWRDFGRNRILRLGCVG